MNGNRGFTSSEIGFKLLVTAALVAGWSVGSSIHLREGQADRTELAVQQLRRDQPHLTQTLLEEHAMDNNLYAAGWAVVSVAVLAMFAGELRQGASLLRSRFTGALGPNSPAADSKTLPLAALLWIATAGGCYRPFEPIKLEVIQPNEEAFLLPFTGDAKKQTSSENEEYLKSNLVYTKQVKIPQQWVQSGYELFGPNGTWQDAAVLVKVDKSPVTREWTADPNSGTSDKNEAIWVMTADQVEFSTGWTITARIEGRDDAVKFLHNYPKGSLEKVLDTEVRSKLQAAFGLEVTDLPMDELRKAATPHIVKVVNETTTFFQTRGVRITNLGISGGFVYKDKTILQTMVRVFNAEQERSVAAAESSAQKERNNTVLLEAEGRGAALMAAKRAEAEGIKLVADAKLYELEKAAEQLNSYVQLKQIELQKELLSKWDGAFPRYFMGGGNPNLLLQLPPLEAGVKPLEATANLETSPK